MTPEAGHYTLDSTLESVEQIEHLALEHAQRAGFCGASLDQIALAVHETAANAVFHGNNESAEKKIFLEISLSDHHLKITITDQGDGFDPAKIPDPLAPQEIFKERGRGIYLSRALMDEYQVRRADQGGSEVTLVKYLKPKDPYRAHT
jgi:serine/threonine-protein kinase RsbW